MPKSPDPQDSASARAAAVALLARRDYAIGELRVRLERKGFDRVVVESTLTELRSGRLLDDARYATNYVGYHAGRGEGPVRIAGDLRAFGVSGEAIEAALAAGPDWRALASEARLRRFGPGEPAGQ